MPKDTKSLNNNKAPACESRGFVHKKEGVHFDTPSSRERNSMSAMNMPDSFQWHFRPCEGVCDTPLHLFGLNDAVMVSFQWHFRPCEGVCDTHQHWFD